MKTPLKMGIRILALIVLLMLAYVLSFGMIMILFALVRQVFPILEIVELRTFRSASLLVLGIIMAYLFLFLILGPIIHTIHWIQALSKGTYKEPALKGVLANRDSFYYKCTEFVYKELFMQMQLLTEKLQQSETDRIMLEKDRRQWLAGITHDLKTPLSYIQGYASLITAEKYDWSESEIMDFGLKIEEKSKHIKNLIDDLNLSFQSEDKRIAVQKLKTEMVEFLRNVVLDLANSPRCTAYNFSFASGMDAFFMEADTVLLQRALQNVLINAVVHNPPGTEIEVAAAKQQDGFCIEITDNGKGMEEETRRNLFESYYRGTSTDCPAEGSGLGMAIAKQFIELHNGSIRVDSTPGQGTSIVITLPVS